VESVEINISGCSSRASDARKKCNFIFIYVQFFNGAQYGGCDYSVGASGTPYMRQLINPSEILTKIREVMNV